MSGENYFMLTDIIDYIIYLKLTATKFNIYSLKHDFLNWRIIKSHLITYIKNTANKYFYLWSDKYKINQWNSSFTYQQWLVFISSEIKKYLSNKLTILIGPGKNITNLYSTFSKSDKASIRLLRLSAQSLKSNSLSDLSKYILKKLFNQKEKNQIDNIVLCYDDNSSIYKLIKILTANLKTKYRNLIYKVSLPTQYPPSLNYISSVFDDKLVFDIYRYSLAKCEVKCPLEDVLDLYQALIQTKNVQGEIAEFGTYRGHSGLVISEIVRRLNINKKIFLCDTYKQFPYEHLGIDRFWSNTHKVNFISIKKMFSSYKNVSLIKGDFFDTIDKLLINHFSFVNVDCDSYRAVKLVTEKIFPRLSKGGIILFEDYGHVQCIGARYAIDEYFKNIKNYRKFFSGFSGSLIITKI